MTDVTNKSFKRANITATLMVELLGPFVRNSNNNLLIIYAPYFCYEAPKPLYTYIFFKPSQNTKP